MRTKIFMLIIAVAAIGILIGLVSDPPANPAVERLVTWNSPETESLFNRACADCHSHTTKWPWYSTFPPASFLIQHDIEEARSEFNISSQDLGEAEEAAEELREGEMPPFDYLLLHPEARLSDAEKRMLVDGLVATFGEEEEEDHDSD